MSAENYFVEIVEGRALVVGKNGKYLKQQNKDGYLSVNLSTAHGPKTKGVHVLVCEAYHGPAPAPGMEVAHDDGVRDNNLPENIYWKTKKQNGMDRVRHGTTASGERNCGAVLTARAARVICHMQNLPAGLRPSAALLARLIGISDQAILFLWNKRTWRKVTADIPKQTFAKHSTLTESEIKEALDVSVAAARIARKIGVTARWINKLRGRAKSESQPTNEVRNVAA